MGDASKIEWCDSTFNPWSGCTKISPACDHCYAAALSHRLGSLGEWGAGAPRKRTGVSNWNGPKRWNVRPYFLCPACGLRCEGQADGDFCPRCQTITAMQPTRRRVFCASLADWLDNEVPIEWLVELLELIRRTPNLDWLLLTKRIGNWRKRVQEASSAAYGTEEQGSGNIALHDWIEAWLDGAPPTNVWLGATICNQAEADRDIPKLLQIPARVRFLSMEPLLGPVDLRAAFTGHCPEHDFPGGFCLQRGHEGVQHLHWVITGGESGPHARVTHPDWFGTLRDQCAAACVPFLFKQWGEWCPRGPESFGYPSVDGVPRLRMTDAGHDGQDLGADGDNDVWMNRAGKRAAGRKLTGREHTAFPVVTND